MSSSLLLLLLREWEGEETWWKFFRTILRCVLMRVALSFCAAVPPDWLWTMRGGGYKHLGTELALSNTNLKEKGIVKDTGEMNRCTNGKRRSPSIVDGVTMSPFCRLLLIFLAECHASLTG